MVQCTFTGEEHNVTIKKHGNSKHDRTPFRRTFPSTINALKNVSKSCPPKAAFHSVTESKGGIINAEGCGSLPRNRSQASYCRRKLTESFDKSDDLYRVMLMCKENEGSTDEFVRHVNCAPQISCILYADWQLQDLKQFCASTNFGVNIMGVDPTFDCGDFDLTVTTYSHPLLLSKRTGKHPIVVGPMFVHRNKTTAAYLSFFSALVGDCHDLSDLLGFGTDGEQALVKALKMQFKDASHLRCFIHFRRNLADKLRELGISQNVAGIILNDIFGHNSNDDDNGIDTAQLALVSVDSDDAFDSILEALEDKWKKLESDCTGKPPAFLSWFVKYKSCEIKDSMLAPLRTALGLGCPPAIYTTNSNESMNAMIHGKNHYSAKNWANFCSFIN